MDLAQAKISTPQIDRIEQRILASLTDGSAQGGDLSLESTELTEAEISQFFEEEAASSSGEFGIVLDSGSWSTDYDRSESVEPTVRAGFAHRSTLRRAGLLSLASFLAISIALVMSTRSMPGSLLYPVRLQAEAIRIAGADGDLQRAQRFLIVARARVTMLGPDKTLDASQIVQVSGEMQTALVSAFGLVEGSKEDPELRTEVAGAVHTSAIAGVSAISRRIPHTSGIARVSLESSVHTIREIAAAALRLFKGSARVSASPSSPDISSPSRIARTSPPGRSRPAGMGTSASGATVSVAHSESDGDQPQDPSSPGVDDCTMPSTTICITIPSIDLPVS